MKHKTDKPILIISAIMFIFFKPAIVVSRYMTCALFTGDNKTLGFEKKNPSLKKIWVLKKTSEFKKKTLSFEKYLGFFKNSEFKKNHEF